MSSRTLFFATVLYAIISVFVLRQIKQFRSLFFSSIDIDAFPLSPGEPLLADEDLDPKQRRLQQLQKRLDIEHKVQLSWLYCIDT